MTTIAQAFNAITTAQVGTPKGGTIVDAIDALTDTLAGSDQPKPQTIADAVTLLGQHIGGGGGETVEFYVWGTPSGTFTANGEALTLTPFESGEFSGSKTTVQNGTFVTYTPSGTIDDDTVVWWPDAQELYDDGDPVAASTIMSSGIANIPIVGVTSFDVSES